MQTVGEREKAPYVILFDGVCNLCNGTVNFIIDHDRHNRFVFAALQSPAGQRVLRGRGILLSDDLSSVILLKNGRLFHKSDAALEIARELNGFWPVLYVGKLIPRIIRDAAYTFLAKNRYRWFGKLAACRIPTPELQAKFLL